MWAGTARACPPAVSISLTAAAQASALRLATTTLAPARAKPLAMARPMPRLPPVTMATRPVRSNESGARLLAHVRSVLRLLTGVRRPGAPQQPRISSVVVIVATRERLFAMRVSV